MREWVVTGVSSAYTCGHVHVVDNWSGATMRMNIYQQAAARAAAKHNTASVPFIARTSIAKHTSSSCSINQQYIHTWIFLQTYRYVLPM